MNDSPCLFTPVIRPYRHLARCSYQHKRFSCLLLCCILFCAGIPGADCAIIVATLPPVAGLVRMLDTQAQVRCLLPPGADAHGFQLAPGQVREIRQADLLIRSSRDDGNWRIMNVHGRILDLWPKKDHAWLLPNEVRRILPGMARSLQKLAPRRHQAIAQALEKALRICDQLEREWRRGMAPFRQRGVIMQHPAWRSLCRHFNVPVLAVLEPRHHGGIRPRQLQHALDMLHAHPDAALWGDIRHANRGLAWLSRHAGSQAFMRLDPLGECGMTWMQLMRQNLRLLARANHE